MNYISTHRTLPLLTTTALVTIPKNRIPFVQQLRVVITSTYLEAAVLYITLDLKLTGLHGYGRAWFLSDVTASMEIASLQLTHVSFQCRIIDSHKVIILIKLHLFIKFVGNKLEDSDETDSCCLISITRKAMYRHIVGRSHNVYTSSAVLCV
jgi:hypothetical protein